MIIATHGILASAGGIVYDADAQAFFDRVTTAGGTLSATEKTAVNQLVLDMKSYSIWSKMKAIYPMVGASSAACKQNLKSSSFTGSFSSGWTFASTGVTPNGSAYMDTGLNPSTVFGTNYAHQSFYSRTNNTSGTILQGVSISTRFDMGYDFGNTVPFVAIGSGSSTLGVDTSTLGFVLSYRTGVSSGKMLRNNVLKVTMVETFSSYPNGNYWLAARNPSLFLNVFENSFTSLGDTLTDTEASNLYTAVQAFQTTLSRQV